MIPETNPYNNWSGNGTSTTFDFDFYIENASQLAVYHTNTGGVQTKLTCDVDYTINELKNKNGSYITFPKTGSSYGTLANGEIISLCLDLEISQQNEFGKSAYINPEVLEYSFDYLTRLIQIQDRKIQRAAKIQEGLDVSVDELIRNISNIANMSTAISTVAENLTNINTVSSMSSNISTVAGMTSNISTVADNLTDINTVSEMTSNISTVADNLTDINTVSEMTSNISTVAGMKETIDEIATDLNGKADVDLSNTSNTLSNSFLNRLVPDYANGISVSSSTLTYTAPAQGFIYFNLYGGTGGYLFPIKINNVEVPSSLNTAAGEYRNTFSYLVDKNDVITWGLSLTTTVSIAFYPLKGAN